MTRTSEKLPQSGVVQEKMLTKLTGGTSGGDILGKPRKPEIISG